MCQTCMEVASTSKAYESFSYHKFKAFPATTTHLTSLLNELLLMFGGLPSALSCIIMSPHIHFSFLLSLRSMLHLGHIGIDWYCHRH